jgi:hypothetical protein
MGCSLDFRVISLVLASIYVKGKVAHATMYVYIRLRVQLVGQWS